MEEALAPGAPLQFDGVPGNVVGGERDPDDVEDALAGADRVVRVRIENPRLAVAPMEGNAVLVIPGHDGDDFDVTAYVSTQMPHGGTGLHRSHLPARQEAGTRHRPVRRGRVRRQGRASRRAHRGGRGRPSVRAGRSRPPRRAPRRCCGRLAGPRPGPSTSELGLTNGRPGSPGCAAGSSVTAARTAGVRRHLRLFDDLHLGHRRLRHPEAQLRRRDRGPDQHRTGRGVPRSRATRSRRDDRAAGRRRRRRAGRRPGRDPPPQPHRARRVPLPHPHRAHLRLRRLRPPAARGSADRRL